MCVFYFYFLFFTIISFLYKRIKMWRAVIWCLKFGYIIIVIIIIDPQKLGWQCEYQMTFCLSFILMVSCGPQLCCKSYKCILAHWKDLRRTFFVTQSYNYYFPPKSKLAKLAFPSVFNGHILYMCKSDICGHMLKCHE